MKMIGYLQTRTQQWCAKRVVKTYSLVVPGGEGIKLVERFLRRRATLLELQFSNGLTTASVILSQDTDNDNTLEEAVVNFEDGGKTESIQLRGSEVDELLYSLQQLVGPDKTKSKLERLDQLLEEAK